MNKSIRVIFAGGGTGGHVYPAIAMAQYFKKHYGATCIFIGTKNGLESRKVPQAGFVVKKIWISGFHRGLRFSNVLFPLKLLVSLWQSSKEIRDFKPDIVVGTGGYVAGPVLNRAIKLKIPTAIQEQNSYPGITTRLLAGKVNCVLLAYEEALQYIKNLKKYKIVGNPCVNAAEHLDKRAARKYFGLERKKITILVFGGSQGSKNINQAVTKLIDKGVFKDSQLIWQTGEREFYQYETRYLKSERTNLHILPFIDNMNYAYAASDFAVCRAGAMTISELAMARIPAILVPYPNAAGDHQYKNARTIADAGGALLVEDNNDIADNLGKAVLKMTASSRLRSEMSENLDKFHYPESTRIIVEELIGIIREKEGVSH